MNDIIKAMEERRSIRKFKADMPQKADLEQIMRAGLYAANGMGKQAALIVAVTDKAMRDRLSEANRRLAAGRIALIRSTVRLPFWWYLQKRTAPPISMMAAL